MKSRGQAALELALCLPVLVALALGGVALARVASAKSGLEAAAQAAAAAAVRSHDQAEAARVAQAEFDLVIPLYPVSGASMRLGPSGFGRGSAWSVTTSGTADLSLIPIPGLPLRVPLQATAWAEVEPWRSR